MDLNLLPYNKLLFSCCVINDVPSQDGFKLLHLYNISPFIGPRLISTQFPSIRLARFVICPNLQFQAEEHSEEDKTETEEADGQADQPSEQSSLPGRIVELLTARYGTAALHSLQRQQRMREQPREFFFFFFMIAISCNIYRICLFKMCSVITACLIAFFFC